MKLLSILVIPALLAAQDQAKTRTGPAWIAWKNGTRDYAEIVRVTDSFVAIRQHQTRTCENVEWSRVADIKHLESTDISVLAALVSILFTFPMLPYWGIKQAIGEHDPKLGSWESVAPNQPAVRLRFTYGENHLGEGGIIKQLALVRTGRYRIENRTLFMRYDDEPNEPSVGVRFECDELLVDAAEPFRMRTRQEEGHAQAPIVGRWRRDENIWEFHSDGTFQAERIGREDSGNYKKAKHGVDITWTQGQENWQISTANGSLFINKTEFKRRPPFY